MAPKLIAKKQVAEDPHHTQAVQSYELGVRALQEHKFEKAKGHLQKVLAGPNKSLCDRAKVHLQACDQHLEKPALQFKTAEEHFDFAVSLINTGDFEEAATQLKGLLKDDPSADFAFYGLALLYSITGKTQDCLDSLTQAIELNPKNRLQARSDNDFQSMVDDPRFTELLYPELP